MAASIGPGARRQRTVRPVLCRSTRFARASTSRCFITAGSETAKGDAISLTDSSGSSASRSRIARRVGSASAAKARSSWGLLNSTIWLSIVCTGADVNRVRFTIVCSSGSGAAGVRSRDEASAGAVMNLPQDRHIVRLVYGLLRAGRPHRPARACQSDGLPSRCAGAGVAVRAPAPENNEALMASFLLVRDCTECAPEPPRDGGRTSTMAEAMLPSDGLPAPGISVCC